MGWGIDRNVLHKQVKLGIFWFSWISWKCLAKESLIQQGTLGMLSMGQMLTQILDLEVGFIPIFFIQLFIFYLEGRKISGFQNLVEFSKQNWRFRKKMEFFVDFFFLIFQLQDIPWNSSNPCPFPWLLGYNFQPIQEFPSLLPRIHFWIFTWKKKSLDAPIYIFPEAFPSFPNVSVLCSLFLPFPHGNQFLRMDLEAPSGK